MGLDLSHGLLTSLFRHHASSPKRHFYHEDQRRLMLALVGDQPWLIELWEQAVAEVVAIMGNQPHVSDMALRDESMSENHNLTEADKEALYVMPDDWFRATDLPYPRVTRAEYRCKRLREAGYLEWRVTGTRPDLKSEYRKKESVSEALKGYFPKWG